MRETARGTFEIAGWDEKTYQELERGGKLSEAKVTQKFTGDIDGEGGVIWLMCYTDPNTAHFVGLQRIVGSVSGRKGSFVIDTDGTFDGSVAKGDWSVILGSGTGALAGISGEGHFEAPHGPTATYTIDYELGPSGPRP